MKCLYCHENVQPDGETCPKCGLPLIEDTTLLEYRETEKASFPDWVSERKSVILAGVGGFAAALLLGFIFLNATAQGRSSAAVTVTPTTTPQPVQLTSAAPIGVTPSVPPPTVSDVGPVTVPAPVLGAAPAVTPYVPPANDQGDVDAPPPLPANFEYDPQWGFPPVPRSHRPAVVTEREPTPPGHVLAMSPFRERSPQYVTVVARNVVNGTTGGSEYADSRTGGGAGGSFYLDGE